MKVKPLEQTRWPAQPLPQRAKGQKQQTVITAFNLQSVEAVERVLLAGSAIVSCLALDVLADEAEAELFEMLD